MPRVSPTRIFFPALAFAAAMAGSGLAHADEAEDKHLEGTAMLKKSEFEGARIKLLQALALRPMPKTMLNLCVVEQQLKLEEEAVKHCRQFVAAKDADAATVKTVQDGILRELESVTARVTIVAEPGSKVEIDGHAIGTAPLPTTVDVKVGVRTCTAGGRTVKVEVKGGDNVTVRLTEGPADGPPKERREKGSWVVPGVLAGLGVVGVGVGVGLGLAASGKANTLNDARTTSAGKCGPTGEGCTDLQDAYSGGKGLRTGSFIAYGVGGAAFLGALVVMMIDAPWKERTAPARPSQSAKVAVVPSLSPQEPGLVVTGRF